MGKAVCFLAFIAMSGAVATAAAQADATACKDHPLFPTRMPEYRIEVCKVADFDRFEFWVAKGPKIPVEGKLTFISYAFTGQRASEPSGLAVVRNYENAIRKVGGTILQSNPTWWVNGKIVKDGQEAWVQVEKGNGKIWLRIVEKKAMEQQIVADMAGFSNDIMATGHAAVYGILFDTGKSDIKPESDQALEEIAKLLKADPGLKLHVVGHTDNEGTVDVNLKLSMARAQAVVQALTGRYGITPARLDAFGCGQYAPIATNTTPDGRARNRRVELVRQ